LLAVAALLLTAGAQTAALAAEESPAPGQSAMLRVELELTGKDHGRPIHRAVSMAVHMGLQATSGYDLLAQGGGQPDPLAAAERERRDARLDKRLAASRAQQEKLDIDALTRACSADEQSAECKRGQAALLQSLSEADDALKEAAGAAGSAAPPNSQRYELWGGVLNADGQSCGTIEGRLLDQDKNEVTRIPRPGVLAVATCASFVALDRTGHIAKVSISPLELLRANATGQGEFLIDGTDVNASGGGDFDPVSNSLTIHKAYQSSGPRLSGSATYRGPRGVTVVRWSLTTP
jgi:hypothetical protein